MKKIIFILIFFGLFLNLNANEEIIKKHIMNELDKISKTLPKIEDEGLIFQSVKLNDKQVEYKYLIEEDKIKIDKRLIKFSLEEMENNIKKDFCEDEKIKKIYFNNNYTFYYDYKSKNNNETIHSFIIDLNKCK